MHIQPIVGDKPVRKRADECPLLAFSGRATHANECPLSAVKRTLRLKARMSAYDQKRYDKFDTEGGWQ